VDGLQQFLVVLVKLLVGVVELVVNHPPNSDLKIKEKDGKIKIKEKDHHHENHQHDNHQHNHLNQEHLQRQPHLIEKVDKGQVIIKVKQARNLIAGDKKGTSDPFVMIHFQGQKWKSQKIKKTVDPVWNETCTLDLTNIDQSTIIPIEVFDKDLLKKEPIGRVAIPLAGLVAGTEIGGFYPLQGVAHGEIEITCLSDFNLPTCDPSVYQLKSNCFYEGRHIEYDPVSVDRKQKK